MKRPLLFSLCGVLSTMPAPTYEERAVATLLTGLAWLKAVRGKTAVATVTREQTVTSTNR